jgi:tetratricopeptide (TPR) repeat protein
MKGDAGTLDQDELETLKKKYEKLVAEDPSSVAFVVLAEILRKQDEFDRAIDVLTQGLKHNPGNITARFILGRIYYDRWMIDDAKREMEEVIKSAPDNLAANKILAEIYRSEGKLDKALQVSLFAWVFNPEDNEIRNSIEELRKEIALLKEKESLSIQRKKDESLEPMSDEEIEYSSELFDEEIYTEIMADLYMNQKLYERAIRIFERLLQSDPWNHSLHMKLEEAKARLEGEKSRLETK